MELEGKCLYDAIDRYYELCSIPGGISDISEGQHNEEYELCKTLRDSGIITDIIWNATGLARRGQQ